MNDATKITYTMDQIGESPYVLGCRKQDKFKVIDVELPLEWEIPDRLFPENSPIFVNAGAVPSIFMFFSETKQFSDIYNTLIEIVRHNKEKEEKLIVLNALQVELQKHFDSMPLADFRQLIIGKRPAGAANIPTKPQPPQSQIIKEGQEPKPPTDGAVLKP